MRNGISTTHDLYGDELSSILRHNGRLRGHKYNFQITSGLGITRITFVVGYHHIRIPVPTKQDELEHLDEADFTSTRINTNKGRLKFFITQDQLELLLAHESVRNDIYYAYKKTNRERYNYEGDLGKEEVINLIRQAFVRAERKRITRILPGSFLS